MSPAPSAFVPTLAASVHGSHEVLDTDYEPGLVVLSIVIAITASYSALDLAGRVRTSMGTVRKVWLMGGAAMMGLGIWSMHFVGMKAFRMSMAMTYDAVKTVVSMLIAVAASLAALKIAGRAPDRRRYIVAGGIVMGLGIVTMHYVGMAAMLMQATITYDPWLVAASIGIAIGAAIGALGVAFQLRREAPRRAWYQLAGAVIMGGAISGMHYTGMAAASYVHADIPIDVINQGVHVSELGAIGIGAATLGGLGLLLLGSMVDIERARTEKSLRFLVDASASLSSLDEDTVLGNAVRLAVPYLADFCAIVRVDGDALILAASAGNGGALDRALRDRVGRLATPIDEAPEVIRRVLREGRSERGGELPGDLLAVLAETAADRAELCPARRGGFMLAPLRGRDGTAGVLMLLCARSDRCLASADATLAEDFVRRVAAALDNAHLYREAAEAVRLRDEFLTIASHELKTPLTPLKLLAQSLAREGGAAQKPPDRLTMLGRQVDRLSRLVDELLDVSRITAGRLHVEIALVDLAELTREVAARFDAQLRATKTPVTITAPKPVMGAWDRERLEQVITNLLTNAAKYGAGKPIEIDVRSLGGDASLSIRDHGIGIEPAAHARIFERFERAAPSRNYGGLGLGLYIVRQIVEAHGGVIRVDSVKGRGATFTVILPQRPSAEACPATEESVPAREAIGARLASSLDHAARSVDDVRSEAR